MKQNASDRPSLHPRVFRALLVLGVLLWTGPRARADSGSTTSISAQDDAISRSAPAAALSPAMPGGPPPLSSAGAPSAGAPVLRMKVHRTAASAPAISSGAAASPAAASRGSSTPALNENARDTSEKVVAGRIARKKKKAIVPGEGLIVDDKGRTLDIVPKKSAPAKDPAAPGTTSAGP